MDRRTLAWRLAERVGQKGAPVMATAAQLIVTAILTFFVVAAYMAPEEGR